MPKPEAWITELTDPDMTLREWQEIITRLIETYGPAARLVMDAGYNNVAAYVTPE